MKKKKMIKFRLVILMVLCAGLFAGRMDRAGAFDS